MNAPSAPAVPACRTSARSVPWQPASTAPLVGSPSSGEIRVQPFPVLALDPAEPVAAASTSSQS